MDIRVLGPLEIAGGDGRPRGIGSLKLRTLVSALVLAEGRPVAPAVLIDRLWGDEPPAEAQASLHSYVSHLRRLLEPGRPAGARSRLLTFGPVGYTLAIDQEQVDAARFLRLAGQAEHASEPAEVERLAGEALALWRGEPYQDLDDQAYVAAVRARLTEARERARELRVSAVIRQHRHAEALGELEALTHEHPLRERLWALRALALYRSGRQGEALEALRTARRILAEELGVDPGEELRALERDILGQSPALLPDPPPSPLGQSPRRRPTGPRRRSASPPRRRPTGPRHRSGSPRCRRPTGPRHPSGSLRRLLGTLRCRSASLTCRLGRIRCRLASPPCGLAGRSQRMGRASGGWRGGGRSWPRWTGCSKRPRPGGRGSR
ncbi:putative transcriptional regulator [[Actinomadura] parvosata subsp. kistnae]|uniref:AfsR/SARP family transcriptional regulator n=1 Tax=[Actinomadura] parvosata TaxID=1955412 RepID=UPI000D2E9856|nr:putative transcriptional regulator [Actinomadura parvosata subsp. kistnae]